MLFMLDEVEYTAVISFIYIENRQLGAFILIFVWARVTAGFLTSVDMDKLEVS